VRKRHAIPSNIRRWSPNLPPRLPSSEGITDSTAAQNSSDIAPIRVTAKSSLFNTFQFRRHALVASCSDGIVGCCTLSAEDPEFWPDALKGEAAYLHKLAVRRTHAGRGVSSALIEACRHAARTQGCAKLRLDCHPNLRGLYERLGFTHVDTFNPGWDPTFIAERLELEI
jgi:GNAT superfamily N-acetyltransferase